MPADVRVFISYVRENRSIVERLVRELRARGADVWYDKDALKPGSFWKDEIRRAIRDRQFFIACFSREYADRTRAFMNEELALAIEEIRLRGSSPWFLPVLLSGHIPDIEITATRRLADIQYVELNYNLREDGVGRLAEAVGVGATAALAPKWPTDALTKLAIAQRFVRAVRGSRPVDASLAPPFDSELMAMTRKLLQPADSHKLLSMIGDISLPSGIRNRCASVVFNTTSPHARKRRQAIREALETLYVATISEMPGGWEVPRAIGLALANQAWSAACILDYLRRISREPALVQANLAQSDRYYGSSSLAIRRYLTTIESSTVPREACIWEAFYVKERTDSFNAASVASLLERKQPKTVTPELAEFWDSAVATLWMRSEEGGQILV